MVCIGLCVFYLIYYWWLAVIELSYNIICIEEREREERIDSALIFEIFIYIS